MSQHYETASSYEEIAVRCQNHKTKEAKYQIVSEDSDTLFYCEKCSIFLASQGFPVEKLTPGASTRSSNCRTVSEPVCNMDISNELQTHIDHVLRNLQQKQEAIRQKIVNAEHYRKEIQLNLDTYFKKIVDYIGEKKREFKRFVESEHRKLLQGYQEHEVQVQKAIIETYDIKDQIADRKLDASSTSYYKNCIMKSRIMCEKLDVLKVQNKKDIVTIDLSQIMRIIDDNLKIKVKVAEATETDDSQYQETSVEGQRDESSDQPMNRSFTRKSIGESEIRRIGEQYHSLFLNGCS